MVEKYNLFFILPTFSPTTFPSPRQKNPIHLEETRGQIIVNMKLECDLEQKI